jgi:hypothetical protein
MKQTTIITTGCKAVQDKMKKINVKRDEHYALYNHLPDGSWRGQRCFILGGGTSLRGFDFERLRGERTIAINKAFLDAPFADILFGMDWNKFFKRVFNGKMGHGMKEKFDEFEGLKVLCDLVDRHTGSILWIKSADYKRDGIPKTMREGLFHGTNSGYAALGLAIVLGANPIYLLGYDMKPDGEKFHYHSGYQKIRTKKDIKEAIHTLGVFKKAFEYISDELMRRRVSVVNLNQESALRCFPFSTIDEVLG